MKIHEFALELGRKATNKSVFEGLRRMNEDKQSVKSLIAKSGDWNPWPCPKFLAQAEA